MRDIPAFDPLFAGLVHDDPLTIAVFGVIAADQVGYNRTICMAMIGGHRTGF